MALTLEVEEFITPDVVFSGVMGAGRHEANGSVLLNGVTITQGSTNKYGFRIDPGDQDTCIVADTSISGVFQGGDAYRSALQFEATASGRVFVINTSLTMSCPDRPTWNGYSGSSGTNFDGITANNVNGNTAQIYISGLDISGDHHDAALDLKYGVIQIEGLTVSSPCNRTLRIWYPAAPVYLVDSDISNPGGNGEGALFWAQNATTIAHYGCTFNGQNAPTQAMVSPDSAPITFVALAEDPRSTGEMHPAFAPDEAPAADCATRADVDDILDGQTVLADTLAALSSHQGVMDAKLDAILSRLDAAGLGLRGQ